MRRLTLASLVLSFLALTACKSGEGERCQVTSDCAEGLACVIITSGENPVSECRDDFEPTADAAIDAAIDAPEADAMVIDALVIDALVIDAPIDAP